MKDQEHFCGYNYEHNFPDRRTGNKTERERLIETMKKTVVGSVNGHKVLAETIWLPKVFEAMADSIIGIGAIVPPVAVGQPVWFIPPTAHKPMIAETEIDKVVLKRGGLYIKLAFNAMYETSCKSIGKTVFLTKEEAEKALKERSEGK